MHNDPILAEVTAKIAIAVIIGVAINIVVLVGAFTKVEWLKWKERRTHGDAYEAIAFAVDVLDSDDARGSFIAEFLHGNWIGIKTDWPNYYDYLREIRSGKVYTGPTAYVEPKPQPRMGLDIKA